MRPQVAKRLKDYRNGDGSAVTDHIDRRLLDEARASAFTQRLLRAMLIARLVQRVTLHAPAAGAELFGNDPEACAAVATAEADTLTAEERLEVLGELPELTDQYCARAWSLVDEALAVLELPREVADAITGDAIALFAAALMTNDIRQAGAA